MTERIIVPRQQALLDERGHPTVPYARWMDRISTQLNTTASGVDGLITTPTPEDYGAVGDGVTDDTDAMNDFFANEYGFGRLTDEATYLVTSGGASGGVSVPGNTKFWGPRSATIENADADGITLEIVGDDVELRGFTVDGGNSSSTVASGYNAGHMGIQATGASGDRITDVRLVDLEVLNCGDTGIDVTFGSKVWIEKCVVSRCGYIGIEVRNSEYFWVEKNRVTNVYPGANAGNDGSNCYGIVATRNGASSVRSRFGWIRGNYVATVTWEGIDEHDATDMVIDGNVVIDVGTGIASQHDETGYSARRITITNNDIVGFGATKVLESVTYRPIAGIICVNSVNSETGEVLVVANNTITSCGDNRSSPGDGAAITIQQWRSFTIIGNTINSPYRSGIVCVDNTNQRNLHGLISSNMIDGVQDVGGTARDIYTYQFTAAYVHGNFAAGDGDGFNQAGGATLVTTFTDNHLYS